MVYRLQSASISYRPPKGGTPACADEQSGLGLNRFRKLRKCLLADVMLDAFGVDGCHFGRYANRK